MIHGSIVFGHRLVVFALYLLLRNVDAFARDPNSVNALKPWSVVSRPTHGNSVGLGDSFGGSKRNGGQSSLDGIIFGRQANVTSRIRLSERDSWVLRRQSLAGISFLSLPWVEQQPSPNEVGGPNHSFNVALSCVLLAFASLGVNDWHRFQEKRRVYEASIANSKVPSTEEVDHNVHGVDDDGKASLDGHRWSVVGLVGLTAYRFYTGFLSATWLPYLLAMEGEDLWRENQSLFMGVAKLIYGVTIMINPIMGRIGDRAVAIDHGLGRRLFVRCGICISALGIFVCLASAHAHTFYPFLFGILLWRLGEALNDVTTEAIIPEMVPPEQYQLAGSIKAASFLLGGLLGYVMLIALVNLHYSWLYYAYLIGMLISAMPALILLNMESAATAIARRRAVDEDFLDSVWYAYMQPMQYKGGFPRFALATFVFTLGTSPMFFVLLMVRDLLGVTNAVDLQRMFSWFSIVFFVSAAVASILSALGAPKRPLPGALSSDEQADKNLKELKAHRWTMLVYTQIAFGVIVLVVPFIAWVNPAELRIEIFFVVLVLFGATFGSGYSRFQDATWQVLPTGDRGQANAMGFHTMCRLLGVGFGNFVAGLMLDCFYTGNALPTYHHGFGSEDQENHQVYMTLGYVLMCASCAICNFVSAMITRGILVDGCLNHQV